MPDNALERRDKRDRMAAQTLLEQELERAIRQWEEDQPQRSRVVDIVLSRSGDDPIVEIELVDAEVPF